MDIQKFIEKYKKKISKRDEDIKDFRESHNPELIHAIPIYERENAEYKAVIAALEKQIAMRKPFDGIDTYSCPCCDEEMESDVEYCQYCGQKTVVE